MRNTTRPGSSRSSSKPAEGPGWRRPAAGLLAVLVVLAWLAAVSGGGRAFSMMSSVAVNDQALFLPASAEATAVQEQQRAFSDTDAIPALLVFAADEGTLGAERLSGIARAVRELGELGLSVGGSPPIPATDGRAAQAFLLLDTPDGTLSTVRAVRETLAAATPAGVTAYVTGPAGLVADMVGSFAGIDGLLLAVAVVAVFIILVFVYRSLLLPVLVLFTGMSALTAAVAVTYRLALSGTVLVSGQTQGILFILVIGATTDYALLYTARFREALRASPSRLIATREALRGTIPPVLASGATVSAGLLCLLLSDLGSNSTLGPVAVIGIAFSMLAGLTLLPAVLLLLGRAAFWPRLPRAEPAPLAAEAVQPATGMWQRIAETVARRPRLIWVSTLLVLAAGALAATGLDARGAPQSEIVLGHSEAREGQQVLGRHFPGGAGSPVQVVAAEAAFREAADVLLAHPHVAGVTVNVAGGGSSGATVTAAGIRGNVPFGPSPEPKVVDGRVLLQATLDVAPDSRAAEETVRGLRAEFAARGASVLVGGPTALDIDTNDTAIHDRNLIIPLVLLVITLILMPLLRSVLAPVLLVASTMLSYLTALGVAALVFNHVFRFPGADPAVPLFSFVFLVALGIDYNIFLMTRVREEALTHGTRRGIVRGLAITGGVITSAGVVLAATFAALGVIPVLFLVQVAFIVAFGVLLDTFVVRTLLVPALCLDIGPLIWWPSRLSRAQEPRA